MSNNAIFNYTPFNCGLFMMPDKDGIDCAVCIVKATFYYDDRGNWTIPSRDRQMDIFVVDQMHPNLEGLIHYPADAVVERTGTDFLVLGHAYGRGESSVKVGFEIDGRGKWLICTGDRVWKNGLLGPKISTAEPIEKIPLTYAHAYGGVAKDEKEQVHIFNENPVGKGFWVGSPIGTTLPNMEYPGKQVENIRTKPRPAAFGALGRHWQPRLKYAGTYDEHWKNTRFPLVPNDFNTRYHSSVPDDQFFADGLRGGESLRLYNMEAKRSIVQLQLPVVSLGVEFNLKSRSEISSVSLDSVIVEPDIQRVVFSLRSVCRMADEHHMLKNIQVNWRQELFRGRLEGL